MVIHQFSSMNNHQFYFLCLKTMISWSYSSYRNCCTYFYAGIELHFKVSWLFLNRFHLFSFQLWYDTLHWTRLHRNSPIQVHLFPPQNWNWFYFLNLTLFDRYFIRQIGYIDVGDGCWRPNVLVTSLRWWWPIQDVGDRFNTLSMSPT